MFFIFIQFDFIINLIDFTINSNTRIRIDGEVYKVDDKIELDKNKKHTIEILVDRLVVEPPMKERITESVELAMKLGDGLIIIHELNGEDHIFSENFACKQNFH